MDWPKFRKKSPHEQIFIFHQPDMICCFKRNHQALNNTIKVRCNVRATYHNLLSQARSMFRLLGLTVMGDRDCSRRGGWLHLIWMCRVAPICHFLCDFKNFRLLLTVKHQVDMKFYLKPINSSSLRRWNWIKIVKLLNINDIFHQV